MTIPKVPPTVLIVDDQEFMFRILQATLKSQAIRISAARSGEAALSHIEKYGAPDAIILDFGMPEMDGLDTLRLIRNLPCGKKIPVLMLTANDQTNIRNEAEGLNIHAFMTKPFGPNALLNTVKEMLESGK